MSYVDAMAKIHLRQTQEASIVLKLLALVLSKPLEQLTEIPKDWEHCHHVDLQIDGDWPDAERELMPMLHNLAGFIAHHRREPLEVCVVRCDAGYGPVFIIAVRVSPPGPESP